LAEPRSRPAGGPLSIVAEASATPLFEVRGLRKAFVSGGLFSASHRILAVRDVGFIVGRGEALALVGESGSGKTTIARLIMRLEHADAGEIRLDGEDVLRREPRRASRAYRRRVQMVFQDPFGSLNPVHDVAHHLVRPLLRLGGRGLAHEAGGPPGRPGIQLSGGTTPDLDVRTRTLELLDTVGLTPAEEFLHRYPYELSGGQRQRVAIARALAAEPDLLVADEPTSMLDVSIRMDILRLLIQLKRERGLAILLITHDLASAVFLAERIVVLRHGQVVEEGGSRQVVNAPRNDYTRALLAAIADPPEAAR
jgi:peptide/nickel transport system ATP-binding protein